MFSEVRTGWQMQDLNLYWGKARAQDAPSVGGCTWPKQQ